MLVIKLKDAMEAYHRRTGERLTYAELAERTGMGESTLRNIGSTLGLHTTLANIEILCVELGVEVGGLLEIIPDPPKPNRLIRKKRGG